MRSKREIVASFDDSEALSKALDHARVRAMQIRPGSFSASLRRHSLGSWSFQFIDFHAGVSACSGDAAPDRPMLFIPLAAPAGCRLLGGEMSASSIGVYAPGAEHADMSVGGLSAVVVAPPKSLFQDAKERGEILDLQRSGAEHRQLGTAAAAALRQALRQVDAIVDKRPAPSICRELDDTLTTSFINAMSTAAPSRSIGRTPLPRGRILRRLVDELAAHDGDVLFASELAARAGISQPTLHRVFHEWFGLPPAKYLLLRRLYLARARLRSGEYKTVTEVAETCCFSDQSRFAKRYKVLFGELPSRTLKI